ncbi:unnamed protein product, partial [Closterium sp. NIES-53]
MPFRLLTHPSPAPLLISPLFPPTPPFACGARCSTCTGRGAQGPCCCACMGAAMP